MSEAMQNYLDSCNRLGVAVNGAVVRIIARRTHEDTSWYDASVCTKSCCVKTSEYDNYFADAIAQGRREDALVRERQENALNDAYAGVGKRIEF
jgi:hypothetical protein